MSLEAIYNKLQENKKLKQQKRSFMKAIFSDDSESKPMNAKETNVFNTIKSLVDDTRTEILYIDGTLAVMVSSHDKKVIVVIGSQRIKIVHANAVLNELFQSNFIESVKSVVRKAHKSRVSVLMHIIDEYEVQFTAAALSQVSPVHAHVDIINDGSVLSI